MEHSLEKSNCLLASFAKALGMEEHDLINLIGHDGSEITHPTLEEPLCRKGFHPQQFVKVCLQKGLYVTRVEVCPNAIPLHSEQIKLFDIGGWDWFKQNIFNSYGVIECRTAVGFGHAMAYRGASDHAIICDNGSEYVWKNTSDTEKRHRFIVALWRIDE